MHGCSLEYDARRMFTKIVVTVAGLIATASPTLAQTALPPDEREARALIEAMKAAERGPFSRIRWFCNDGAVLPPRSHACSQRGGGHQHGELSEGAHRLAELGYRVGTVYAALSFKEFLDASDNHNRLREIVLQAYLWRADDGWVERRSQFYRGARQVEDEEDAGRELLVRLFSDSAWIRGNYLLAIELVRSVPHGRAPDLLDRMRRLALELGDSEPEFQPLRIKIHQSPDPGDIVAVETFLDSQRELDPTVRAKLDSLRWVLDDYYRNDPAETLARFLRVDRFRRGPWREKLARFDSTLVSESTGAIVAEGATLTGQLRREIESSADGLGNLHRLDLALAVHEILVREWGSARGTFSDFQAAKNLPGISVENATRWEALRLARSMIVAAYGRGLLFQRELQAQLVELAQVTAAGAPSARAYRNSVAYLQRSSLWAHNTVEYHFGATVSRYLPVEPTTEGFADDLLRSTVLLPLADVVDALGRDANRELGLTHRIFDTGARGAVHGLNPGIATGVLEFVREGSRLDADFRRDRIYVLPQSYADLPPVGGIITLSEGSSVSHLQLLARSLGIPNAVIPATTLETLRPYFGREVMYVVSPLGSVILQPLDELTAELHALLAEKNISVAARVSIDPAKLDFRARRILALDEVLGGEPGRVVGPKAAGVARLYLEFPGHVPPGLVIPFGVFRAHLDRQEERDSPSLYEEMVEFYARVGELERKAKTQSEISAFTTERLAYFRSEILRRDFDPAFVRELRDKLSEWGAEGTYGVFVRSDTNVEDLAEFSGAGLNLTVPNQVRFEEVLTAIKQVWASPFEVRAYAWRQSIIDTPEHTYVSVLLQRSVPAEKSGVLITADLQTDSRDFITVSTSEGSGGVVSGELSESLLLPVDGKPRLLAQAKAAFRLQMRTGGAGGVEPVPASGSEYVLTQEEISRLKALVQELDDRFEPEVDSHGRPLPWDVEFGFLAGELLLFQIRPLASDPATRSVAGLVELDRAVLRRGHRPVDLHETLAGAAGA